MPRRFNDDEDNFFFGSKSKFKKNKLLDDEYDFDSIEVDHDLALAALNAIENPEKTPEEETTTKRKRSKPLLPSPEVLAHSSPGKTKKRDRQNKNKKAHKSTPPTSSEPIAVAAFGSLESLVDSLDDDDFFAKLDINTKKQQKKAEREQKKLKKKGALLSSENLQIPAQKVQHAEKDMDGNIGPYSEKKDLSSYNTTFLKRGSNLF